MKLIIFLLLIALDINAAENAPYIIHIKGTCSSGKSTLMRCWTKESESLAIVDEDAIMHKRYVDAVSERFPEAFDSIQKVIAKENLYHALREKDVLYKSAPSEEAVNALTMIQEELNQDLPWKQLVSREIDMEVLNGIEAGLRAGKNVLLDSWYITPERLRIEFRGIKIIKVLLYCPLPLAYERFLKRNKKAHAIGNLSEKRYLRQLIGSFTSLYQINSAPLKPIQNITREELDPVFDEMENSLTGDGPYKKPIFTFEEISKGHFLDMKEGFLRPFTVPAEEFYLEPKAPYDIILINDLN